MLVKYAGNAPFLLIEFNRTRYAFSNRDRIKDIPPEVLKHIYTSGHIQAMDFIPLEAENNEALKKEIKTLTEENVNLKLEIVKLEKSLEKKRKKEK